MKKAQENVILAYIKTKFYTFASRKSFGYWLLAVGYWL